MAKKFMYVCLGILALAIAFHLGARSAASYQTGFVSISKDSTGFVALKDDGTVYYASGALYEPFPEWHVWRQIPAGSIPNPTHNLRPDQG